MIKNKQKKAGVFYSGYIEIIFIINSGNLLIVPVAVCGPGIYDF